MSRATSDIDLGLLSCTSARGSHEDSEKGEIEDFSGTSKTDMVVTAFGYSCLSVVQEATAKIICGATSTVRQWNDQCIFLVACVGCTCKWVLGVTQLGIHV
jgi:hypothetical protein